jgi:mannose-6-phosphate isomerase-like protein (cupin superfamily)
MIRIFICITITLIAAAVPASAQTRTPTTPSKPFIVKTSQEVADIYRTAAKETGNKQIDIAQASGTQMRVAVFHDETRENDLFEVHDSSDDIYLVLDGKATLMLGGALTEPNEISPGEWRSKTAAGGQKIEIQKGDLIVVPRGTVHQRTVTGKGFSMVLIKVFAENVKPQ